MKRKRKEKEREGKREKEREREGEGLRPLVLGEARIDGAVVAYEEKNRKRNGRRRNEGHQDRYYLGNRYLWQVRKGNRDQVEAK